MAVLLIEGFDSAQASKVTAKGWSVTPSSLVAGRFGGSAARTSIVTNPLIKVLPVTATTVIVGAAFKWDVAASGAASFFRALTGAGALVGAVGLDTSHRLQVYNAAGAVVATGTTVLTLSTWNYLEMKVVVGTSGSIEVRLNGVTEIAATTANLGTTAVGQLGLRTIASANNFDFDDVYVLDTTGPAPRNDFLGDVRAVTLFPTADGANSAWTPNSGTAHFSRVNEASGTYPDDDTSYVSDSTPGHTDTYAFADLPAGATAVYGVQVNMYARKDDAGTRTIAPVVRQAGSDNVGATQAVASTYAYLSQIYQQDPAAADWSVANVNGDEFGVREIA